MVHGKPPGYLKLKFKYYKKKGWGDVNLDEWHVKNLNIDDDIIY